MDCYVLAAFFTGSTEGFLFDQCFLVLDSLTLSLFGKFLLAFKLGLLQGSSGFSGGHLRSSSLIFGCGNSFLGISSTASFSSITLIIFELSLGLGSRKLCG